MTLMIIRIILIVISIVTIKIILIYSDVNIDSQDHDDKNDNVNENSSANDTGDHYDRKMIMTTVIIRMKLIIVITRGSLEVKLPTHGQMKSRAVQRQREEKDQKGEE
jgi:hypothetical protein